MLNLLVYANCQGSMVDKFVVPEISKYLTVSAVHIVNYEAIKLGYGCAGATDLPEHYKQIIRDADVIVYQPLSEDHGVLSTSGRIENSFITQAKSKALKISFPYVSNSAIWPTYIEEKRNGISFKTDPHVVEIARSAHSEEDLIKKYMNGEMNFNFSDRFDVSIKGTLEREKETDVKISDFIRENISKKRLFLTHNHPATAIMSEMARQIIDLIASNIGFEFDQSEYMRNQSFASENTCKLPGYYPIDFYSIRHYNFEFVQEQDFAAPDYYKMHMVALYNLVRGRPAEVPFISASV